MSDSTALLSILAVIITGYFGCVWVVKITNERGDEILSGVVKGVPASRKQRWLMLFNQWLPSIIFYAAFLLVISLGILEIARGAEQSGVRLLGYMGATLCAGAAVFSLILGTSWFVYYVSVLRQAEAD